MKHLDSGKIAGILAAFLLFFPVRFAMADVTVERTVTVSTDGDPYIATAFNEDLYGLDWTTSDTKTLVIILSAPTGKEIKVTSIVTEDAKWLPKPPSQWGQSHTYTALAVEPTHNLETLFTGLIRDKEPVPGVDVGGKPPEWKAGVILADIQADANNTGSKTNDYDQRLPSDDPEERAREKVAARAGADNPTGLIVPLNRGHHQGEEEEDYLVPGINTEDPDLVKAKLVLNMHAEVEKESEIILCYDNDNLRVYDNDAELIESGKPYVVVDEYGEEKFGKVNWLYVEGVWPSATLADEHIWVLLIPQRRRDESQASWKSRWSRDRVKLTVMDVEITASGDYIVPGSARNRVEYAIKPTDVFAADSGKIEVFKNDDSTDPVRAINLEDFQIQGGNHFVDWDGLDDDGNPLKETEAPYGLTIKANWQGAAFVYETSADVKEWQFTITIPDRPAYDGATTTGIDMNTVTTEDDMVTIEQKFLGENGDVFSINHIDVSRPEPESPDVDVLLLRDGESPFIFYTSPTNLPVVPKIRYKLTMEVDQEGCVDGAYNQWDMDGTSADWENMATWEFSIDPAGNWINKTVEYSVSD